MKKLAQKQIKEDSNPQISEPIVCEKEIELRAYKFWESGGRQQGNDMSYWLLAEREVQVRRMRDR